MNQNYQTRGPILAVLVAATMNGCGSELPSTLNQTVDAQIVVNQIGLEQLLPGGAEGQTTLFVTYSPSPNLGSGMGVNLGPFAAG
ncbi:hypothetical protein HYW21_01560 [Candidatus Woesearchaeota archaeon]|nr:hypothetical protein [Candidatus Woesearchaeota archaeon]